MLEVWCLKWGSKYKREHVAALAAGVRRFASFPHLFVCYTDDPCGVAGVIDRPLPEGSGLNGWWFKVWMLGQPRPFLYFDLDVVITGDPAPLIGDAPLTIIRDPWQPMFNSSVFHTDGSLTRVWETFTPGVMRRLHGDQNWITEQVPHAATYEPGLCLSYKAEVKHLDRPPASCRVVYFHGRPKPWDVNPPLDWMMSDAA